MENSVRAEKLLITQERNRAIITKENEMDWKIPFTLIVLNRVIC